VAAAQATLAADPAGPGGQEGATPVAEAAGGGAWPGGGAAPGQAAALARKEAQLARRAAALVPQARALAAQAAALQRQANALSAQGGGPAAGRPTSCGRRGVAAAAGRRPAGPGRLLKKRQQQAEEEKKQTEQLKQELTDELTKAGGDDRGTDPRLVKLQDALATPAGVQLVSPPSINKAGTRPPSP
jgi:hypothetical protein